MVYSYQEEESGYTIALPFSGSSSLPEESWSWPPNWTTAAARKSWGKNILCRCSSCREKSPGPGGLISSCSGCKCQTEHQRQPENWKLWGWWNYQIIHTWNNQADDILRIGYDCHDSHVDSAARRQIWRGGLSGSWVKWRITLTWHSIYGWKMSSIYSSLHTCLYVAHHLKIHLKILFVLIEFVFYMSTVLHHRTSYVGDYFTVLPDWSVVLQALQSISSNAIPVVISCESPENRRLWLWPVLARVETSNVLRTAIVKRTRGLQPSTETLKHFQSKPTNSRLNLLILHVSFVPSRPHIRKLLSIPWVTKSY